MTVIGSCWGSHDHLKRVTWNALFTLKVDKLRRSSAKEENVLVSEVFYSQMSVFKFDFLHISTNSFIWSVLFSAVQVFIRKSNVLLWLLFKLWRIYFDFMLEVRLMKPSDCFLLQRFSWNRSASLWLLASSLWLKVKRRWKWRAWAPVWTCWGWRRRWRFISDSGAFIWVTHGIKPPHL